MSLINKHSLPRLITDPIYSVVLAAHVRPSSKYGNISKKYIDTSKNLKVRSEAQSRCNNGQALGQPGKPANTFKTQLYSLFHEGDRHSAVARAVITGARPRSAAILRRFPETLGTENI